MRRLLSLVVLLLFAVPFGVSIAGCSKGAATVYCNGQSSGVVVGQTTVLDLEPRLTGYSLNQGEITTVSAPSGKDCRGSSTTISGVVYGIDAASRAAGILDVQPTTGRLCGGTWNRNSGGGVADYTTCTPATTSGQGLVTASAEAVTSNAIPVYVHPTVTSIVLGPASTNCATDPASNCAYTATYANGCGAASTVTAYTGNACLSQGTASQLVARVYKGTDVTNSANNISCLAGPLTFSALDTSVVTIDTNGVATAAQPGLTTINAAVSQSSSSAGFFSTCPPAFIVLAQAGSTTAPTAPIAVNQNTTQQLSATVTDTNGNQLTNINLTYVSTTPTVIPASSNNITPTYPGSAAITALCQPPTCNNSAFNQIGLYGNGTLVTSNPVQINATGTANNTVLYIASTGSQYIQPYDFTVTAQPSPIRLNYVPNSMVLSTDLSSLYIGTANEIITVSTSANTVSSEDTSVVGKVLAVSPDSGTVVITDPTRNLTYLYTSSHAISSEYGGVATHAVWSPDSTTVYITTTDGRLLVHSTFTGWTSVALSAVASDVTVTIPQAGVYLGGSPVTARTVCPTTTITGTGLNQITSNVFYPQSDVTTANATSITATNDGVHILGASTTAFTDITTNKKSGACTGPNQLTFTSTTGAPLPLTAIAPTAITGVLPTSDSAYAFVTYTGTGGVVPQYTQSSTTGVAGVLSNVALQTTSAGTPTAPVAGVLSSDNTTLFLGTSGDNIVHRLARGTAGYTDSLTPVVPALPAITGTGYATPNLLAQRPRKSTS